MFTDHDSSFVQLMHLLKPHNTHQKSINRNRDVLLLASSPLFRCHEVVLCLKRSRPVLGPGGIEEQLQCPVLIADHHSAHLRTCGGATSEFVCCCGVGLCSGCGKKRMLQPSTTYRLCRDLHLQETYIGLRYPWAPDVRSAEIMDRS